MPSLYWMDISNISRKGHRPGTLAAHANYITNHGGDEIEPGAGGARRNYSLSVNLPRDRDAFLKFAEAYELFHKADRTPEETARLHYKGRLGRHKSLAEYVPEALQKPLRQDARWGYKIMHALPASMPRAAQIKATRDFLWTLTVKGRGFAYASFHDLDTHNPHVHILFIDRDRETGRSVALLSAKANERRAKGLEPNSTVWVREAWTMDCNAAFAHFGIDDHIDHRSYLDRGLKIMPGEHRGPDQEPIELDHARTLFDDVPPEAPSPAIDAPAAPAEESVEQPEPEAPMAEPSIISILDAERDEEQPANHARILPVTTIAGREYYVDSRLMELRAVDDPHVTLDLVGEMAREFVEGSRKGIDLAGEVHPDAPSPAIEAPTDKVQESSQQEPPLEEADMASYPGNAVVIEGRHTRAPEQRIEQALYLGRDLTFIRTTRREIELLSHTLEGLQKQREAAQRAADRSRDVAKSLSSQRVETRVATRHLFDKENNKRGFKVFGWSSPTRKRAEKAEQLMGEQLEGMHQAKDQQVQAMGVVTFTTTEMAKVSEREADLQRQVNDRYTREGTAEELDAAEISLQEGVEQELEGISAEDILQLIEAEAISQEHGREALQLIGAHPELERLRGREM